MSFFPAPKKKKILRISLSSDSRAPDIWRWFSLHHTKLHKNRGDSLHDANLVEYAKTLDAGTDQLHS